jgi:hypothetical protein
MVIRDTAESARKTDATLTGFRDPHRLAKPPAAEQAAWRAVWAEVDALLAEWQFLDRDLDAQTMVELERRVPALLRNEDRPTDRAERSRLAGLCYRRKLFVASARFLREISPD